MKYPKPILLLQATPMKISKNLNKSELKALYTVVQMPLKFSLIIKKS